MSLTSPLVLVVDDEPQILYGVEVMLRRAGIDNVRTMSDSRQVIPSLVEQVPDLMIIDLQMPYVSGQELLAEMGANHPQVPVIVVTAANEVDTAVACMKAGAFDYLVKPIETGRLSGSVRKALEMAALKREITSLREGFLGDGTRCDVFAEIPTRSSAMQAMFRYLLAVAPTDQPILITGETGVGKELVARGIHSSSGRSGRYVTVNVAGLDDQMFSDTLFGHRKGAFTGADQHRPGLIAEAAGGTVFLDEIGDLSPSSQVKLLRLLQQGEYHPLGSDTPHYSQARVVAATNHDLKGDIQTGTFRKDLYYRLCAHQVRIPPLRERRDDIPLLLEIFLEEAATTFGKPVPTYPRELLLYLSLYHFPGNVRQLKAMVFDAMARHPGGTLAMVPFRAAMEDEADVAADTSMAEGVPFLLAERFPTLLEAEQYLMAEALERAGGNQGVAASLLGISRQALNKRLSRQRGEGD